MLQKEGVKEYQLNKKEEKCCCVKSIGEEI